ncbi:MAG TPA: redox-sensitive transcriptional activator SoxR [Candidatus Limnocylindria bacterium]|nr:redox-sensitive transcriptional activator SoxR [Candidatus Limnocylindria bacterium]
MPALPKRLTIGQLSARSGVAPSALRFYEDRGLIRAERSDGHQRRYARSTLRTVAFIRAAQRVGVSLDEIAAALSTLPTEHPPTLEDWARLSTSWRGRLNERIAELEALRDKLTSCIGCGCLSLRKCGLFNRGDQIADRGAGPRLLYPRGLPPARGR